jgi:sporulation protein YlmC with PRC-barrel domain
METIETENLTGKNRATPHINTPLKFLTATSIIGDKVLSVTEESMGAIKDIMIDVHVGKIEYVVIELGGFLGMGEKFFAIPYSLLSVDAKNQTFIFSGDVAKLKNAPGFDKDHWPKTNSHEFDSTTSYWGGFMGANTGADFR